MSSVLSISIVSHGQGRFIRDLLHDLVRLNRSDFDVILTLNLPEELPLDIATLPFRVTVINNEIPRGFAANHNTAFLVSQGSNFVILNPDVKIVDDPFAKMLLLSNGSPGAIVAPMIINKAGELEDSARNFPTLLLLVKKLFAKIFRFPLNRDVVPAQGDVLMPDWVSGAFLLVPRTTYAKLHGLNERYHMYYEDVDFCVRAKMAGLPVLVDRNVTVVHEAQRDSHRNLRFFLWHLDSIVGFFTSKPYLKMRMQRMRRKETRVE